MAAFMSEFPFWLQGCASLTKLKVEVPANQFIRKHFDMEERVEDVLEKMMARLEKRVGVVGVHFIPGEKWVALG